MRVEEPHDFLVQFIQDKKVMKEYTIEAFNVREATSIALNIVGHLIYWNEIKVETL
jgi:hypothetical protein